MGRQIDPVALDRYITGNWGEDQHPQPERPEVPGAKIPISEIYGPVIQGEGSVVGRPTVFVRTGGCDYRCTWCDSLYAVLPEHKSTWTKMTAAEILGTITPLAGPGCLITLSGGNPALHDLRELIDSGHQMGYTFAIETQGTVLHPWAYYLDDVTISPKPPSSGMKTSWGLLRAWTTGWPWFVPKTLKVVVFDDRDYEFAKEVYHRVGGDIPFYLQPGTQAPYRQTDTFETMAMFRNDILFKTEWLQAQVIADRWYDVRVLPQVHALINGAKRGV